MKQRIVKTEGVVLRTMEFSRTSEIVTWLTSDHGKINTIVKGAKRPKSQFLGQYDLFYTCELLYYQKQPASLHILRECSPVDTRQAFRQNWESTACASYICDLVTKTLPAGAGPTAIYELLEVALNSLCGKACEAPPFLFWFELRFLELLGLAPQMARCLVCGRNIQQDHARFSFSKGGVVCEGCVDPAGHQATRITPDILAMMRRWQSTHSPKAALSTRCSQQQIDEIRKKMGSFLRYHLDKFYDSRDIALRIIHHPRHKKSGITNPAK